MGDYLFAYFALLRRQGSCVVQSCLYIAKDGLDFLILLCAEMTCSLACPLYIVLGIEPRFSCPTSYLSTPAITSGLLSFKKLRAHTYAGLDAHVRACLERPEINHRRHSSDALHVVLAFQTRPRADLKLTE